MPENVFLLIQPGVDIEILEFTIPADLQPEVIFSVIGASGKGLIPDTVEPEPATLDAVNVRFMLTYIPEGDTNKVNYHERFRDNGGVYTDMGDGVWMYKFATVLPADYEVDATHTLAATARRDLREFSEYGLERYYDNDVYNFVPSGAGDPMPRDIIRTSSCNNCHNPIAMHGGTYREVQVCTQCHNPATLGGEGDELSYEFSAVIHRVHSSQEPELDHDVHFPAAINDCQVCHTGGTPTADMPLVANPDPTPVCDGSGKGMTEIFWGDAGSVEIRLDSADGKLFGKANEAGSAETGKWVSDGRAFFLVDAADGSVIQKTNVNTTVYGCADNAPYSYGNADGTTGDMHANWMTNPNREACGGCHTYIDWETGEGHAGGAQEDDEFCSFCHQADTGVEFDRSVKGAHTVPLASSALGGVYVDIKSVTNTGPGQKPTVVFSVMSKNGLIDPASLDRLLFVLSGPNEDFEFYAQENVLGGLTAVGTQSWSYTFSAAIPSNAKGSFSVGFEGRITTEVNGEDERDSAENYIVPVAVTDSAPMARRMVVDDAKCEACHSNLSLHGDNRKNAGMYCQTCHRPDATDEEVRLEGEDEGIHFKYMIHKIHRGAELENLPYIIYGYRSSVHDYSDVHFPGDLRDCEQCHLDDTYTIGAIPDGALPTHSPAAAIPEMEPITAACLSCHDSDATASHALANSSDLGESCDVCHGDGKTYSVEKVHAR